MRVLALDFGSARCGCAVTDPTCTIATPLPVIERPQTKRGMRQLRELVRAREIDAVVVGLPLSLSGADTEQTRAARSFAAALSRTIDIPVELYDERFTTRLAQRMHTDPKAPEDSRAAALLLESWIAAQSR